MDGGTVEHDPCEVAEVQMDVESTRLAWFGGRGRADFLEHIVHKLVTVPLPPPTVLVEVVTQLSELH